MLPAHNISLQLIHLQKGGWRLEPANPTINFEYIRSLSETWPVWEGGHTSRGKMGQLFFNRCNRGGRGLPADHLLKSTLHKTNYLIPINWICGDMTQQNWNSFCNLITVIFLSFDFSFLHFSIFTNSHVSLFLFFSFSLFLFFFSY